MRLWTIQPIYVYDKLKENGILYVDPKQSEILIDSEREARAGLKWTFKDSYDWMVSMMDENNIKGRNENTFYPWWAWHTYDGKNKKPDLRRSTFGKRGRRCVCIELEIPDDEVLLTSYTWWHDVLMDCECWLIDVDTSSCNDFDTIWKIHHDVLKHLTPEEYERYKKDTWKKIINHDDKYIQATFWCLRLNNVIKVQEFICK